MSGPGDPLAAPTGIRGGVATDTTCTAQDSIQSGYGSGACGGIDYGNFEYDPATGTEYVATPDPAVTSTSPSTTTTTSPTTSPTAPK